MTRVLFEQELSQLRDDVLVLGSMAEKALVDSMESLRDGNIAASERIIEHDVQINAKRFDIEDKALLVIATQQPMAQDLREVVSVLYIITDLERIADHAEGIARINVMLGEGEAVPRRLGKLPPMADRAEAMLRDSLKAFINDDVTDALRICDADDEVDNLQDRVYEECIQAMIDDPTSIERNTYMLWTAHNLERIADRCTNICERVVFKVTGEMREINVSSY